MSTKNYKSKKIFFIISIALIINIIINPLYSYADSISLEALKFYSQENPNIDNITEISETELSKDGKIYIEFPEEISLDEHPEDGLDFSKLEDGITLYRLPGAEDAQGQISYELSDISYLADVEREEISIEAQIQEDNKKILIIDPKEELLHRNSYQIIIQKELLIDNEEKKLEKDINQVIWTKEASEDELPEPKWTGVTINTGDTPTVIEDVYDDDLGSYSTTLEAPVDPPTPTKPIILHSDSILIPSTVSQAVYTEDDKYGEFRLYEKALDNILLESNSSSIVEDVKIDRVVFKYNYEHNKTDIHIYPERVLSHTVDYRLFIPQGEITKTFEARNGQTPETLTVIFSIKSKTPETSEDGEITESEDDMDWYDETTLRHDKYPDAFVSNYYFIQVTFDDEDGSLDIRDRDFLSAIRNIQVNPQGTSSNFLNVSFIDKILQSSDREGNIDKYLLVKNNGKATLYIPVKPLLSGTKYNVTIPQGTLYFPRDNDGNESMVWSFITSVDPIVSNVIIASVSENYDEDQPIYIEGDFFHENDIRVRIGGEEGYVGGVRERTVIENGKKVTKKYLEVYLPDGSNRLGIGIHDIEVINDSNHTTKVYGAISVVAGGEYVPSEEYRIKNDTREGEVRGDIEVSEDTLILNNRYANYRHVKLDLDELMGADVLVKKIEYKGHRNDTIGLLDTKSRWSDISIFNLTVNDEDKYDISLRLGRAEPNVVSMLQNKLWDIKPKSEFIQITGENYSFSKAVLSIPYRNSNGKNLKALRYDEETRSFYSEKFSVDLVEKIVRVDSSSKGIFVIVED